MMSVWNLPALLSNPWLAALSPTLQHLQWPTMPSLLDWSQLPTALRPQTTQGHPIQFADPASLDDGGYETRIACSGIVATRPNNWHDTFNALCWLAWPQAKAALNALHLHELAQQSGPLRSRVRDAATLLDESGVILAYQDPATAKALQAHDWQTLFVHQQAAWGKTIAPYVIGHALMEKSHSPYIGVVGKAWLMPMPARFFSQDAASQIAQLDRELAEQIQQLQLLKTSQLLPLPMLGIPHWWPHQDANFYANDKYFRPKRLVTHPC